MKTSHTMLTLSGDFTNERLVFATLIEATSQAGGRIYGSLKHQFYPEGFSAVALIAESHASIHTWPDEQTALVDYFTCSHTPNEGKFVQAWTAAGFTVVDQATRSRGVPVSKKRHSTLANGRLMGARKTRNAPD